MIESTEKDTKVLNLDVIKHTIHKFLPHKLNATLVIMGK